MDTTPPNNIKMGKKIGQNITEVPAPIMEKNDISKKIEKPNVDLLYSFKSVKLDFMEKMRKEPCFKKLKAEDIGGDIGELINENEKPNKSRWGFTIWKKHYDKKLVDKNFRVSKLKSVLKLLFCVFKPVLLGLYIFYFIGRIFVAFLKALNIPNMGRSIIQVILLVIAILADIVTFGQAKMTREVLNWKYVKKYDDEGNYIETVPGLPLFTFLHYLFGTIIPFQLYKKSKGFTYGFGGIGITIAILMFISIIIIILGGINIGVIMFFFISYMLKVLFKFKNEVTNSTSSNSASQVM